MNNALCIKRLKKKFKEFELKSVSFQIPEGSIMGLVGPNGSGKTTIIKSILSLVNYDEGEIHLFDKLCPKGELPDNVGIVADFSVYSGMWRIRDVEKMCAISLREWNKEKFFELLEKFKISPKKKVSQLSRGMNVKLMIAVAFARQAKFLILDEPTSGLDPVARYEVCELMNEYVKNENSSILFSTHQITDLDYGTNLITLVNNGNLLFSGLKDELTDLFSIIEGDSKDVDETNKSIYGCRTKGNTFIGMIKTKKANDFTFDTIRPATIEDIVIYSYGGIDNE